MVSHMRYIYTLLIILCCNITMVWAHNRTSGQPDFNHIKKEITNPNSPFYYPTLTQKYNSNDTTMTSEEYRYFYLGYIFQEDYNPYRSSAYSHQIDHLYKQGQKLSRAENENLVKFAKQTLEDDPFDLRQINILIYALKKLDRHNEAAVWQYRLNHLIEAVLSTGDGKTPETAWHVVYPKHEYIILNKLGMKGIDFVFVEPYYDYIEIEKNALNIEGFYFNVEQLLDVYATKFCYQEQEITE